MLNAFFKSSQNLVDKAKYSGPKGTAIDILRLSIEKANLKFDPEGDYSNSATLPIQNQEQLISLLSKALEKTINFQQYSRLSTNVKKKIKNTIAEKILSESFNFDSSSRYFIESNGEETLLTYPLQKDDVSSGLVPFEGISENLTGLSLNYKLKNSLAHGYGIPFQKPYSSIQRHSVNFPQIFFELDFLEDILKGCLFNRDINKQIAAFSSIINGRDDCNQDQNYNFLPVEIVERVIFFALKNDPFHHHDEKIISEKVNETLEDANCRANSLTNYSIDHRNM